MCVVPAECRATDAWLAQPSMPCAGSCHCCLLVKVTSQTVPPTTRPPTTNCSNPNKNNTEDTPPCSSHQGGSDTTKAAHMACTRCDNETGMKLGRPVQGPGRAWHQD